MDVVSATAGETRNDLTADAATTTPYRMRLLAGWADTGTTADLAEHHRRYVPLPLAAFAGRGGPARLIGLVERSGLRGRGGGGFPTARKLAAVAAGRGPRTVVANGCEGDPAGAKDRVLMELAPHLVIDGILLAAHAVGATDGVLCVHEHSSAVPVLAAALRERRATRTAIRIVEVPRRYVASEETALVGFLDGGGARPRGRIPRPTERGVRGRPTLVDNVETLAHLALIARHGDAWFRAAGTDDSPGTTLVTVGGAVNDPGVYEIELGTPIGTILQVAGGPFVPVQAVLLGGLGGTWLGPEAVTMPLSHAGCRTAGAALGIAAVIALPAAACGIAETARVLRFLADESAGQCGPCMFGLPAIADDMDELALMPDRAGRVAARLRSRLGVIPGRGACAHPDGAVRLAASALHVFADDVAGHAEGGPCRWVGQPSWMPVPGPVGQRR